jgi:thioredoxin-related protein
MQRFRYYSPAVVILVAIILLPSLAVSFPAAGQSKYIPVTSYDPKRDAAQDIDDAIKEAARTNKRILLAVGGKWCSWCHTLDSFFETHPELLALRDKNFVTVKINFSEENQNTAVLARYDPISAYPHLFVLERDGKLLRSQETGILESGKSYDLEKLTAFITKWSPVR